MAERLVMFSDGEKAEIATTARDVARVGEELVWDIICFKVKLMSAIFLSGQDGLTINDVYYTKNQLRHEVDIMEEVTNQASLILQLEGRDSMSELDRHTQKAGLGSVFDPESEISKRIGLSR